MKPKSMRRGEMGSVAGRVARLLGIVALVLTGATARTAPTYAAATDTVTVCDDGANAGTLRNVVGTATSGDTITFSCSGTITLSSSPISIDNKTLIIDGSRQSVTLDGGKANQIFTTTTSGNLTINNLTLTRGSAPSGDGGAIRNGGSLTVNNSVFTSNTASAGNGGAIASTGALIVTDSTFTSNSAHDHGGAIDANDAPGAPASVFSGDTFSANSAFDGGAAAFGTNNPVSIVNSTFTGNSATNDGDALYTYARITLLYSTVAGNSGSGSAIGLVTTPGPGSLAIVGSILDNANNCGQSSQAVDGGSNLTVGADSCGLTGGTHGDLVGTDPQLSSLANNGGPTQTMALPPGSPAIGAATCTDSSGKPVTTDQRGVSRPAYGCTIGAFEAASPLTITGPQDVNPSLNPLTLSGAAPAGSTLNVYESANCAGTPIASNISTQAGGTWSTTLTGVSEGSHTYTAGVNGGNSQCSSSASANRSATVIVDTTAPVSTISFPGSASGLTATDWQSGCNTAPWNVTFSICGASTDTSSGIAAVVVEIQDTDSGFWWNGAACQWQSTLFGNLAVGQGGSGASGGFTSSGGGFTSSGGGFTSSGGGFTSSGGGFTSSGGGFTSSGGGFTSSGGSYVQPTQPAGTTCLSAGGGFTSSGGGFTSSGGGFTSSGGGFTSSGGGFTSSGGGFTSSGGASVGTPVSWYYPTDLPSNGHYSITVQAIDNAGNVEGGVTNTAQLATHPSATVLVGGQIANADSNGGNELQGILPNSTINITFTEPMDLNSLNSITLTTPSGPVSISPTCTDGGYCENVKIGAALSPLTAYTLTIPSGTCTSITCTGLVTDQALNGVLQANGDTTVTTTFTTGDKALSSTTDSDGDGIPDAWDGYPITLSNGTTINTGSWGFTPTTQDICVVEDYMAGTVNGTSYDQHITQAANQDIVNAFRRHNIHLVIFEGLYSAGLPSGYTDPGYGRQIPMTDRLGTITPGGAYKWNQFDQIRNQYFVPTGLAQFCHFAVIAHTLGGTEASGTSRGIHAGDLVVALGTEPDGVGNEIQQAGSVMHELGHNLDLRHGGDSDTNNKPNYPSVMNYNYQFRGVLGGTAPLGLDYSNGNMAILNESSLSDAAGIGPTAAGFGSRYRCTTSSGVISNIVADATAPINWGCLASGPLVGTTHAEDVNNDGRTSSLTDYNDWANLQLSGDGTIGFGASTSTSGGASIPTTSTVDVSTTAPGGVDSVANVQATEPLFTWTGFFSPLDPDSSGTVINTGKAGKTYPVKFQLQDATGNTISSLNAVKSITYSISSACNTGSLNSIDSTTSSAAGLHYDSTANQYVYNWSTPSSGGCLLLKINLADNTTREALFALS